MKGYSLFLNDVDQRMPEFKPNRNLDALLAEIHRLLKPGEMQSKSAFSKPKYPLLLVLGNPRSGTTLTMQYIPNYDSEFLQPEEAQQIDERGIRSGLAAIESVFDKPFAAKATILLYNIPDLLRILPKAVFLYVRRNPFYVIQSILEARIRHYGDRKRWWSSKPPQYEKIKDLDPIHQVAGQVYYTDRAISKGLQQIPEKNQLTIDYEFLCQKPQAVYSKLREKFAEHDYMIEKAYSGPEGFESRNKLRVSKKEASDIMAAYEHFSGIEVTP